MTQGTRQGKDLFPGPLSPPAKWSAGLKGAQGQQNDARWQNTGFTELPDSSTSRGDPLPYRLLKKQGEGLGGAAD